MNTVELSDRVWLVSLVVVAFSESDYLPRLFEDIVAQDFPHGSIEVVLVDSNAGADSAQRQLMESFAQTSHGFKRVTVLDNPKESLPAGCNVALGAYYGDVFLRVDGHARIPSDFVRRNVEVLEEGHEVCGGLRPVILAEPSPWGEVLLALESSVYGASAAGYRRVKDAQIVKSVFHGAYRRRAIEKVKRYDERLRRTEDNDFSNRLRRSNIKIISDPRIRSEQYLRPGLSALLKQKAANGFWIGRTIWLKPRAVSFLHLVPLFFVTALIVGLMFGLLIGWLPLQVLVAIYLLADLVASLVAVIQAPHFKNTMLALPLAFLLVHLSYGFGTLAGLLLGYCLELVKVFRFQAKRK